MADDFGRAVYTIAVTSDAELRTAMQKNEGVIRQSTDAMQNEFTELNTTIGTTGDASLVASAGVTALGQAATATGSSALMATANIANLGLGLKLLGANVTSASTQLKLMGAGFVKFLISPAGLVVVAITAIGTAIAVTFSETARNKIAGIGLGLQDILDKNELLAERLKQQNVEFKKRVQLLEDQVLLETTGVNRALQRMRPRERELTLELERVKAHNTIANSIIKEKSATLDRVDALRQEAEILRGERDAVSFITNELERQATLERDRARFSKDAADAKDQELAAWRGIVAARGPQTRGEALLQIQQARTLVDATQQGLIILRAEFQRFVSEMNIGATEEKLLRRELGLADADAAPPSPFKRAGFLEVSAFATSGRAVTGLVVDPAEMNRRRQEDQRTRAVVDSEVHLRTLATRRRGARP